MLRYVMFMLCDAMRCDVHEMMETMKKGSGREKLVWEDGFRIVIYLHYIGQGRS